MSRSCTSSPTLHLHRCVVELLYLHNLMHQHSFMDIVLWPITPNCDLYLLHFLPDIVTVDYHCCSSLARSLWVIACCDHIPPPGTTRKRNAVCSYYHTNLATLCHSMKCVCSVGKLHWQRDLFLQLTTQCHAILNCHVPTGITIQFCPKIV
jgi:hypothetical protein